MMTLDLYSADFGSFFVLFSCSTVMELYLIIDRSSRSLFFYGMVTTKTKPQSLAQLGKQLGYATHLGSVQ